MTAPLTSRDLLRAAAERHGDAEALVHRDRRDTFAGLLERACRLAGGLASRGIRRGDRVALWLPNWPEWVFARHALGILGAITVPINTRYKTEELTYCLAQSGAKALLAADRFLGIDFRAMATAAQAAAPALEWIAYPDDVRALLAPEPLAPDRWPEIAADDVAYILYTSGTTSASKGVQLTHRNLARNTVEAGRTVGLGAGERVLAVIPLFSSFGTCHISFATLSAGATMVLQDHFDPLATLELLARERVTYMIAVDTMVLAIADTGAAARHDLSALRRLMGAPLNAAAIDASYALGVREVWTGYGLTEAAAISGLNLAKRAQDEALFRPLPGVEIRVVDPETGRPPPLGAPGELQIRGGHVTPGYYRMPVETAALLAPDGWMHTGDLGREEAPGLFRFLSRLKEVIKTGGFLVAPLEVEAVLGRHPAVAEACVIPVPDPRLGETGLAVVQLKPGAVATESELLDLCRARLAGYKVPKRVVFVDDYPRTATGKIQRARLKQAVGG
ncbi:MAG: AMP-binding protein [Candidatus Rokubacteria bacterium]|nr:AMP-binding protein [Candidatus Rokubacteria bacterium]